MRKAATTQTSRATDCCIATRSAAHGGLRSESLQIAAVERLFETLAQTAVRRELETLCGYDTRETGRRLL